MIIHNHTVMWIKFKNNISLNMDLVIQFEKSEFGSGIIFRCNGLGIKMNFSNCTERNIAYDEINKALDSDGKFYQIDIDAKTE